MQKMKPIPSDPEERKELESRFLELMLERTEYDPETGCRVWNGNVPLPGGYVQVVIYGVQYMVCRLAQTLFNGPIPEGHVVIHKCGNPSCIEPSHLMTGTPTRANHHAAKIGKIPRGRGSRLPVTSADMQLMLGYRILGHSYDEIARLTKTGRPTVMSILKNKSHQDKWEDEPPEHYPGSPRDHLST